MILVGYCPKSTDLLFSQYLLIREVIVDSMKCLQDIEINCINLFVHFDIHIYEKREVW